MRALGFSRPPLARRELGLPAPLTLPWLRLSLSLSHTHAHHLATPGFCRLPPAPLLDQHLSVQQEEPLRPYDV
jgi:hypothetical protein